MTDKGCNLRKSITLMTVGFFFMLNPVVGITDVIPDFIGWSFIYFGLREMSVVNSRMKKSRFYALCLIALDALKLAFSFVLRGSLMTNTMTATLIFTILELLCVIGFYNEFLGGYSYLAIRRGGNSLIDVFGNTKFMTIAFYVLRFVLPLAAELTSIFQTEYDNEATPGERMQMLTDIRSILYILAIVLVLVMGIAWFISMRRLGKTAKNDEDFISSIETDYYVNYYSVPEKVHLGRFRAAAFFAVAGLWFFLSIEIDRIRLLPDAAGVLLLLVSCIIIGRIYPNKGLIGLASCALAAKIASEVYLYWRATTINFMEARYIEYYSVSDVLITSAVIALSWLAVIIFVFRFTLMLEDFCEQKTGKKAPSFAMNRVFIAILAGFSTVLTTAPFLSSYTSFVSLDFILLVLMGTWSYLTGSKILDISAQYAEKIDLEHK